MDLVEKYTEDINKTLYNSDTGESELSNRTYLLVRCSPSWILKTVYMSVSKEVMETFTLIYILNCLILEESKCVVFMFYVMIAIIPTCICSWIDIISVSY